jgi:hypothetical protein
MVRYLKYEEESRPAGNYWKNGRIGEARLAIALLIFDVVFTA